MTNNIFNILSPKLRSTLLLLIFLCGITNAAWADPTKSTWDGKVPSTANVTTAVCNGIGITGSGTKDDPYVISDAGQFAYFASKMNKNTAYWKLADNVEIDLDGEHHAWTYGQNNANFMGHFDGNRSSGSLISNMKFATNASGKGWGLFPNLQGSSATNHAEVKNLEIKNFTITTPTTGSYASANVGLLVGKANGFTDIENITVTGGSITVDVETTSTHNVAAVVGQLATNENFVKNCSVSNVTITSGTAQKKEYYVGGITGNAGNYAVITGNTVSNLTITIGGNTNGNNIIGGLIGKITGVGSTAADGFPMGKRSLVQKNTVTSPTITMNGSVDVATFELGGLIGWVGNHTNAFNNKVTSPTISLNNNINAVSYVGGAIGYLDKQTFIDGVTVDGTGAINGPSTDKIVKNAVVFFVGGFLGYQNSSAATNFDANKFKNIAVTGMSINLAHYKPQSQIKDHKFSVGGIAGSINSPNMKADGTWGGMPENLIFKGGKIYAPWASTSPTVSNFNAAAMTHQNMTPDVVTTIDNIEKAKVNTWYYNDYKLGLSNEFLTSGSVTDQSASAQHLKFRKNYSKSPTEDNGIKYLAVDDETFAKSNRYQDSERDSKTVLWWTQQASMDKSKGSVAAVTCFTANEQPIYPQSGATTAQAGNLTDYPHYMYFFQGVANAKYADNTDAQKIVDGIEANFTNNIVPSIIVPSIAAGNSAGGSLVSDGVTVTITNEGETRRGFDNRTLTVALKKADGTDATGSYTYQWYVDGVADGTGTTKTLTPHWKDSKGITINVLNGSTIVATASYGFAPGVLKTSNGDLEKVRSDINGRGTKDNPYIIDCENALRQLSYLSTAHTSTYWETLGKPASPYPTNQIQGHYNRAYYELGADIDLKNTEFTPISHVGYGSDGSNGVYSTNFIFQGVFDGAGHTISNFNITWGASQYVGNGANLYYGLFGAVGGAAATRKWGDDANGNTVIKNLIIDNATLKHNTAETSFYYDQSISTNANNCFVGVLAGIVSSNTTIQNIEIRGSKITDDGSNDYSLATKGLYVGGAIGGVQHEYKTISTATASLEIQHIAAQVAIALTKPKFADDTKDAQLGLFNIGGIIGRYCATSATYDQAKASMPKYTIYSGTVDAPKAWVSPVLGALLYASQKDVKFANYSKLWEGNNNTAETQIPIDNALYYNYIIGTTKITDTTPASTCGRGARTMSAHTDGTESAKGYSAAKYQGVNYGARYVDVKGASLEFMNGAPFEKYNWVWKDGFVHMSTDPYVEARISRDGDTFTASLVGDATAQSYKWQATFDGTKWIDIPSATAASYTAPKSLKPKYIVALVNDGTKDYRTLVELVEPDKTLIDPSVTQSNDKTQYTFNLGATGNVSHLAATNEWYYTKADANNPKHNAESKNATWTPDQASIQNGIVWCKVIVKELDVIVYEDLLVSGATIVYVDAVGGQDNTNGSTERGWTRETAVKTLDHANSLLKTEKEGGTMESNVIVIKGALNSTTVPFRSKGRNPATISGKWDNTDANTGKIILVKQDGEGSVNPGDGNSNGHHNYVSAATKFENLIFEPASSSADNLFIECHGHDVWFGKGIKMGNFNNLSSNHGNMADDSQTIPELSIILTATNHRNPGGLYNREKPQVITIESGHYGRILGGRYTSGFFNGAGVTGNDSHAIQGSAEQPAWAVINVDIDENNQMTSVDGTKTYTCDVNCIIAGLTDGSAYGDYEINMKGGNVRYIVGANQGNGVANGTATYTPERGTSGNFGQWPNSSFFGRTVINVDKTPGSNGKLITLGNVYAGGLGRYADAINAVVDMYIYGHTEVNVRNGNITGSLYGGGAGGVLGRNPWDAHVPYKTDVTGTDVNQAIINGVQYGDNRRGSWSTLDPATAEMAKVTLHNLKEDGTYATEELDLAESSTTINISGGTIGGSVYGGGDGFVTNMPAELTMQGVGSVFGTTNINITGGSITGSVYGGSKGSDKYFRFSVKGTKESSKTYDENIYGQVITNIAEMNGNVNLSITGTEDVYPTIGGNIYGAGLGVATQNRTATKADVAAGVGVSEGQTYSEEYADIARTGTPENKSTITINIDLPDSHPFTGNIYGGGQMGKVDGNIYVNIKNGVYKANVFGAGLGEENHTETKAVVTGDTYVNIQGAKIQPSSIAGTGNVYGGGQLGKVIGNTNVTVESGSVEANVYGGGNQGEVQKQAFVNVNGGKVYGNVFGGGNEAVVGTAATGDALSQGDARDEWASANGTSVVMAGDNAVVFGDIFGGGNQANVEGNTSVRLTAGKFGGNVFGGGNGVLNNDNTANKYANVTNNTSVLLEGVNVMWNTLWDNTAKEEITWDGTWDGTNLSRFVSGDIQAPVFRTMHNVYGGGNNACRVAGNTSVRVEKGFADASLLRTNIWQNAFNDNANPHFYVFGGGYGAYTSATNTFVNVGVTDAIPEDATTDEQLAKGGRTDDDDDDTPAVSRAKGKPGDDETELGVYDNSYGIPEFTVLGVIGGGYAGFVTGNTDVSFGGNTFAHRIFGGGYGQLKAYSDLPNTAVVLQGTSKTRENLGEVGGYTSVKVNGGFIYGDIFGGGAGVESAKINSELTDFPDMGRVIGNGSNPTTPMTSVLVTGTAKVYGNVYGGGDVANVGVSNSASAYATKPTSVSTWDAASGSRTSYTHTNAQSFLNIMGGEIFGKLFAGGNGRKRAECTGADGSGVFGYQKLGRIEGNTLLHIGNEAADAVPTIWNRIYAGGSYGTVNGNTLLHVEGGMLGHNLFGGGYGDVAIDKTDGAPKELDQVLGKVDENATFANVLGNTKVQIDGGIWIWDRFADDQGNITVWDRAQDRIFADAKEFRDFIMSVKDLPEDEKDAAMRAKAGYVDPNFFVKNSPTDQAFRVNHNMFGAGNRACVVGTWTDSGWAKNTGKSELIINHSPLALTTDANGNTLNMLDPTTLAGFCWYSAIDNTAHPQFSAFGAGYGVNTKVKEAYVYAGPGVVMKSDANLSDAGRLNTDTNKGGKTFYASQREDLAAYNQFESEMFNDFNDDAKTPESDLINYYGSSDGKRASDVRTFLRYRASRLAWSMGMPNFTFMDIHGGGFSGYVTGDATVVADCQLAARNVYGGGLGSKPVGTNITGNETYGEVGGKATVELKAGIISLNVFGGGAGVESFEVDGTVKDFPNVARVKGSTEVTVWGEPISRKDAQNNNLTYDMERVLVFGSVYGGGDVAVVGEPSANNPLFGATAPAAVEITESNKGNQKYATTVSIKGASVLSHAFAGGKGRTKAECSGEDANHVWGYQKVGAVYGNTRFYVEDTESGYPYVNGSPAYQKRDGNGVLQNSKVIPYLWNRVYGGCQNGTVYGNTLIDINGGYFANNIFGGGWGDDGLNSVRSTDDAPMGRAANPASISSANVTGNTNILINGGEAKVTSLWNVDSRTWSPATHKKDDQSSTKYSPQYDPDEKKFTVNHNIYGGGHLACEVKGNTYITMTKGMLHNNQEVRSGVAPDMTNNGFFGTDEWHEIYDKVGSPHFCVFGAGYGPNTEVSGNTNLLINLDNGNSEETIVKTPTLDDKKNLYKHFVTGQSVMDIVGGGYEGTVKGSTNVTVGGETFCRRVFGGGFYAPVGSSNVKINAVDCNDIFGGGLMGDIGYDGNADTDNNGKSTVTLGWKTDDGGESRNKAIWVHNSVYGGNDVSGNVITKATVNMYGGNVFGNIYGAGNGNYLYALGVNNETQVTVNEHYMRDDSRDFDGYALVYTVPMRESMASAKSASPAQKIVNINSWRPITLATEVNIKGNATNDKVKIAGKVFGGGNSATVQKSEATGDRASSVKINIGNYVDIGEVYMGSDGDAMFENRGKNSFLENFETINNIQLEDTVRWDSDPANHGISRTYLPTDNADRPKIYPHLLDLYFQPVEMDVQAELQWNGTHEGTGLTDCTIGTFCCGGNRGNMNVYPSTETGKKGNVIDYIFPEGLTITNKIVGGCNNANLDYKSPNSDKITYHTGGYLLGQRGSKNPMIKLLVKNEFSPAVISKDDAGNNKEYSEGLNVYGGCYLRGTINGDIEVDYRSDMLKSLDDAKMKTANKKGVAVGNLYGAGYGMESYVYGDIKLIFGSKKTASPAKSGAPSVNFVYGGGQQGNVIGNTNVRILNGKILKSVTGGSYSGFLWGSTQVLVGYPSYYTCQKSGVYNLKRTDEDDTDITVDGKTKIANLNLQNEAADGKKTKTKTIKQDIHIMKGDIISEQVFDAIKAYDDKHISDAGYTAQIPVAFGNTPTKTTDAPTNWDLTWDDINITIGEAVYGGGYSLASGSSVLANNTTVLKYTSEKNKDNELTSQELTELNNNNTTAGYGGNTTMLIADATSKQASSVDKDHISISSQTMEEVTTLPDNADLFGYYYLGSDQNYHYIYQSGKYTYADFKNQTDNVPAGCDNKVYQYDGEGGVFGDGHLSYAEGFRNAELTGYGFASSTPEKAKILNTFQRMDMLRLTDNCFVLLGARDYTVNEISTTPYSVSRVGEVQMISKNVVLESNKLATMTTKRSRNYMGFSNNIHFIGAVYSNVAFDDVANYPWRKADGSVDATPKSYKTVKQTYIDGYYTDGTRKGNNAYFQQRNDGTAHNMIGIASGYALKIQNVQEVYVDSKMKENIYYGPIYGVIEMNLIDVREDEGGGYVYADNIHKRSTGTVDFLETTGNFVFPYSETQGRHVVDDCFPKGYDELDHSALPETHADIHYWYVTGFNYFYNAHITGYTYDSRNNELKFDLDNVDNLMTLSGAKAGQTPYVYSITWRSGHEAGYKCDLENRNSYDPANPNDENKRDASGNQISTELTYTAESAAAENRKHLIVDSSGKAPGEAGYTDTYPTGYEPVKEGDKTTNFGYSLGISAANNGEYSEDAAAWYRLPFEGHNHVEGEEILMQGQIPTALTADASIGIRLTDKVDNHGSTYYENHLSKPCKATIILTLPAYKTYDASKPVDKQNESNRTIGYIGIQYFYTRSGTEGNYTYTEVTDETSVPYNSTTKYYYKNSVLDRYTEIDLKEMYRKATDSDTQAQKDEGYVPLYTRDGEGNLSAGTMKIGGSSGVTYYFKSQREYTYTINLTIDYVQGPSVDGEITINNCALPGEMIRLSTENVKITSDVALSPTAYYWRIGPREKTNETWTFRDHNDSWKVSDISGTRGYDTYQVGSNVKTGVFKNCNYNSTDNVLDVPAYYFMNGYGVQYGFTVNGIDFLFPVEMKEKDALLIHNYHRMDPNPNLAADKKPDLHLAQALARAKDDNTFPQPRIYISTENELAAFVNFVDTIGTGGNYAANPAHDETVNLGGNSSSFQKPVPRLGEFAQFFLQNDITVSNYNSPTQQFNGRLHGDGHIIRGLGNSGRLFSSLGNSANIHNLGLESGAISNTTPAQNQYHCCFEYNSGNSPVVYRMDGSKDTHYTLDDFRLGKVAYDLNQYYLDKRYVDGAHGTSAAQSYVENYFANGDYQYARRSDEDTKRRTGIVYLRSATDSELPNYGSNDTRHNMEHTIDKPRAVGYEAAHTATDADVTAGKAENVGDIIPESRSGNYLPLCNAAQQTDGLGLTDLMNDYIFFGQSLQQTPDAYPSGIASRLTSAAYNRVWRASGFYGDKQDKGFHFNAYKLQASTYGTYVHIPATTAIDFTGQRDTPTYIAGYRNGDVSLQNVYYQPVKDVPSVYASFHLNEGVTRNVLVYTDADDTDVADEAADVVKTALGYTEATAETNIKGHQVYGSDNVYTADLMHLVDKQNFNAPIQFTATKAWYDRNPAEETGYVDTPGMAWESICLPYAVHSTTLSEGIQMYSDNGSMAPDAEKLKDITFFWGNPTAHEMANPATNNKTLHHHYWLRELKSVSRPMTGAFADKVVGEFERPARDIANNGFAAYTPYIVSFPGTRFYEFDMTGQSVTFGADNAKVGVTDDATTMTKTVTGASFIASFTNQGISSDRYAIDIAPADPDAGTKFTQFAPVYAFRGYLQTNSTRSGSYSSAGIGSGNVDGISDAIPSTRSGSDDAGITDASSAHSGSAGTSTPSTRSGSDDAGITDAIRTADAIYIGGITGIESIFEEDTDPQGPDAPASEYLRVIPRGNGAIRVESSYATTLRVYSVSGQLLRILDVRPGTATYSGFAPGIYIANGIKIKQK